MLDRKRKWEIENPEKYRLQNVRARAKEKGVPFDLEVEDVVIPDFCPILEIPLIRNTEGRHSARNSPSVDCIVREKGYVKGNIQVISTKANCMKSDATPDELRKFAKWVLRNFPDEAAA